MPLPFSLAAPPPDVFAASKAVPLIVNIFMLSLHLQVITALPGKNNNHSNRVITMACCQMSSVKRMTTTIDNNFVLLRV